VASLSSVERYDPHLDKWIEVKEMGQRRAGNGVSELHGCLYVVGKWMVTNVIKQLNK
jgi:kelch-like protein 8